MAETQRVHALVGRRVPDLSVPAHTGEATSVRPGGRVGTALRLPAFRVAGTDRYKRQTLLLDPTGTVRHVQMPITDPAGSVTDMLATVRALAP